MRLRPDPFIVSLVGAAVVATVLPASGDPLEVLGVLSSVLIGLLFFLYGTRLSAAETLAGLRNWRLQAVILVSTFLVFPLLGLAAQLLEPTVLAPGLAAGVLLLCLVPSTVQGCVVYTRMAGGNVSAAVVSASTSNLIGVFATPALVALLMTAEARVDPGGALRIVLQLLAPFVAGQASRPLIGRWVARHDGRLRLFDRATIVVVVYAAFSRGAEADIWSSVSGRDLAVVALVCVGLWIAATGWTVLVGRVGGFSRADRIALLFCGSNKSLASGLPMATVLFAGADVALIVLPLMLYHQFQLIMGALIAPRIARRAP